MVVTAQIERRNTSLEKLHTLLETRTQTLVQFSQLAGYRPFQPQSDIQDILQEFCQTLIDYTASAHFQLYQYIVDGTERRKDVRSIAELVYPLIKDSTAYIIAFNDKYDCDEPCEDYSGLDADLSKLGEALAERIAQEDKIIQVLTSRR